MNWDLVEPDAKRRLVGKILVQKITEFGLNGRALRATIEQAGSAGDTCLDFLCNPRSAVWYISKISDASMAEGCVPPKKCISEVIWLRLQQNATLKPFVRRVMIYDVLHPFQAISRMQRTAQVMFACKDTALNHSPFNTARLNLVGSS